MVVRVPRQNCKCTIDLFADEDAGELVRKGHGAEGEQQAGTGAIGAGPPVDGAKREDDVLAALIAPLSQPLGEGCGGKLFAALIKHHQHGRGSAFEPVEPCEESVTRFKDVGFHFGIRPRSAQILRSEAVKALASCADCDGSKGDVHGWETPDGRCAANGQVVAITQ